MSYSYKTTLDFGDDEFTFIGPQLMSDKAVAMRCKFRGDGKPARFIVNNQTIEAISENITEHEMRGVTSLSNGTIIVRHVEHILSALMGMEVLDTDISTKEKFLNLLKKLDKGGDIAADQLSKLTKAYDKISGVKLSSDGNLVTMFPSGLITLGGLLSMASGSIASGGLTALAVAISISI